MIKDSGIRACLQVYVILSLFFVSGVKESLNGKDWDILLFILRPVIVFDLMTNGKCYLLFT